LQALVFVRVGIAIFFSFISIGTSPIYSVARWGLSDNSITATACGLTTNTFIRNNAYFNSSVNSSATDFSKFFVADEIISDSNSYNTSNLFPSTSSIVSLYDEIGGTDIFLQISKITSATVSFRGASIVDF
jgi:hypothetical protein